MQVLFKQTVDLEIVLDDKSKEIATMTETIKQFNSDIVKKSKELDTMHTTLTSTQDNVISLQTQVDSITQLLEDANSLNRTLELQLKVITDANSNPWHKVDAEPLKFKGESNPLSNLFPCEIEAFGQKFTSVEHAYHHKNAIEQEMFEVAESIKSKPTALDAKAEADKYLSKEKSIGWEEKSLATMRYLLEQKQKSCLEFQQRLKETGTRHLVHNVHSMFWGTGNNGIHGQGQNILGQLLIEIGRAHV
jgi:ribA/ribD-fused uncharacterized protein